MKKQENAGNGERNQEIIEAIKSHNGLLLLELAETLGISDAQVSRIKNKSRNFTVGSVYQLREQITNGNLKVPDAIKPMLTELFEEFKIQYSPSRSEALVSNVDDERAVYGVDEVAFITYYDNPPANAGRAIHDTETTLVNIRVDKKLLNLGSRDKYMVLRVSGDSMNPTLADGDRILIFTDSSLESCKGKVVVVNFNGETVVKRYAVDNDEHFLHSDNSEYGSIKLQPNDGKFIGQVTYVLERKI